MVMPPPIVTSKPPQNENRGYGPGLWSIGCGHISEFSLDPHLCIDSASALTDET